MTHDDALGHLPIFRGKEFRPEQLDAILAFGYGQRDLEESRSLFSTKWWDYRSLHLCHSVFLFAHYYGETVDRWRSKFGISPYAKLDHLCHPLWRKKGILGHAQYTLVPDATRTGWLRATLFADSYGIPYDRWISWAFEYAFECQWKRIPNPTNLYSDRMAMFIHRKWAEESEALIALPTDPRYLAANYCGHTWQDEFQKWLMDQIAKRSNHVSALRNFLKAEPLLLESAARARFGDAHVNAALFR